MCDEYSYRHINDEQKQDSVELNNRLVIYTKDGYEFIVVVRNNEREADVIDESFKEKQETYTVTYKANGGQGEDVTQEIFKALGKVKLQNNNFSKDKYIFVGWSDKEGNNEENRYSEGAIYGNITGDITIYANWALNTIKIDYKGNGGKKVVGSDEITEINTEVEKGVAIVTASNEFSKLGYRFKNWKTTINGEERIIEEGGTLTEEETKENLELLAQWEIETYTITYDVNGGNPLSGEHTQYTVEDDDYTLPTPTREGGYAFVGWTGSNGTTPQKTVTIIKGVTTGNKTYTANWQEALEFGVDITQISNSQVSMTPVQISGNLSEYTLNYVVSGKNQYQDDNAVWFWSDITNGKIAYIAQESTYYVWLEATKNGITQKSKNYWVIQTGHTHSGNSSSGGGCYNASSTCNSTSRTIKLESTSSLVSGSPKYTNYCKLCGASITKSTSAYKTSVLDPYMIMTCNACGDSISHQQSTSGNAQGQRYRMDLYNLL